MIQLLGNIIGFIIFAGIIYLIIKTKGTHPENFQLEEGEEIVEMSKGDYWKVEFLISKTKSSGEFAFTNKRIIFRQNFFGDTVSVLYSDIKEIKKSFIMFFPISFDVVTKEGESFRFAMLKRDHFIDLVNSLAGKNAE